MAMIKTSWVEYTEGRYSYRIRATYGVDEAFARRFNQDPHFSITAEIEQSSGSRWHEDSGGCLHTEIVKHFPKLAPLVKWHLFGVTTGPMHYVANGLYWFEIATGRKVNTQYGPKPLGAFWSTIVYGGIASDAVFKCGGVEVDNGSWQNNKSFISRALLTAISVEEMKTWLESRLPALVEAFQNEMKLAEVTW